MKRRLFLLSATLCLYATAAAGQTASEYEAKEQALNAGLEKQALIALLQGRRTILKQTLYSIIDSDPENPNIKYSPKPATYIAYGITIASPELGTFYRHRYGSTENTDRDPQTLLAKVGRPKTAVAAHKEGTPLTVRPNRGVLFGVDSLTIIMIDELDKGGPMGITTTLTVQWPHPFSSEFPERKEVELVINKFLDLK